MQVHCSDYMMNTNSEFCDGHNEDNGIEACNNTILANITLIAVPEKNETSFMAFCYLGELCTTAFGWNKNGIAFSLNHVFPKNSSFGYARTFIIRRNFYL